MAGGGEPSQVKKVEAYRPSHRAEAHRDILRGRDILRMLSFADRRDRISLFNLTASLGLDPARASKFLSELKERGIDSVSRHDLLALLAKFSPEVVYTPDLVEKALLEFGADLRVRETSVEAIPVFRADLVSAEQVIGEKLRAADLLPGEKAALELILKDPVELRKAIGILQGLGIAIRPEEFIRFAVRGLAEVREFSGPRFFERPLRETFVEAYKIGRLIEFSADRGLLQSHELGRFVVALRELPAFRNYILERTIDPMVAERFFAGMRALEIADLNSHLTARELQRPEVERIIEAGRIVLEVKSAVEEGRFERVREYLEKEPELAEKALEELGAAAIDPVLIVAEERVFDSRREETVPARRQISRLGVAWGAGLVKRIADRTGQVRQIARVLIRRIEISKVAEAALPELPEALPDLIEAYRSAETNSVKAKLLSDVIVNILNNTPSAKAVVLLPHLLEMGKDERILSSPDIREALISFVGTAAEFNRDLAFLLFVNRETVRRQQQVALAEKRRIEREEDRTVYLQVASLVTGIKRAVEAGDFEKVQQLSLELERLISKSKVAVPEDVRYLLGFVAAKVDTSAREKSVRDVEHAVVSGQKEGPRSLSIIQTIAEAEINLALKDDFEPAEELGLYAEAVVFSNIIKATALTTRAKTILNLIMGDESLWSELETLSASGRYDEVRQIISSIVKSARSYDRFLGRESILAGINFYKEWDRSALAA